MHQRTDTYLQYILLLIIMKMRSVLNTHILPLDRNKHLLTLSELYPTLLLSNSSSQLHSAMKEKQVFLPFQMPVDNNVAWRVLVANNSAVKILRFIHF